MSAGPAGGWMNLMTEAYITGVGAYLPGDPVGNTELAARTAALKAAVSALRLGEHPVAVAVGSELASRSTSPDRPRNRVPAGCSASTYRPPSA
jgi:3-oxoacyl-[acyl-carrier-protein] synthase III